MRVTWDLLGRERKRRRELAAALRKLLFFQLKEEPQHLQKVMLAKRFEAESFINRHSTTTTRTSEKKKKKQ
jgi:hypothetical protein